MPPATSTTNDRTHKPGTEQTGHTVESTAQALKESKLRPSKTYLSYCSEQDLTQQNGQALCMQLHTRGSSIPE